MSPPNDTEAPRHLDPLGRLRLGAKLSLAPLACLALMVAMALTGLWGLRTSDRAIVTITEDATPRQLQGLALAFQVQRLQMLTYSYLASRSASFSEAQLARIEQEAGGAAKDMLALTASLGQEGDEALPAALRAYAALIDGVIDIAKDDMSFATTEMARAEQAFAAIQSQLHQLNARRAEVTARAAAAASQAFTAACATMAGVTLVSLALTLGLGWWVRRSILGTVAGIAQAAQRLKEGDLTSSPVVHGRDEIAGASRALADTVVALRSTIATIGQGAAQIDAALEDLARGNQDFSARTEQAAATLQRVACDMSGLSSQVSDHASQAAHASTLARASAQEADRGGLVVGDVVAVMNELSRDSRQIQDITGVIDGIAFQTNILALNAAVEAAGAGEHGRGFNVVAGEVRSLSQRSAKAASDIKELVTRSVARIDTGVALAAEAGQAMERILDHARQLNAMVEHIAAVCERQSLALETILQSISVLDAATQHNTALVRNESHGLVATVQGFRTQ